MLQYENNGEPADKIRITLKKEVYREIKALKDCYSITKVNREFGEESRYRSLKTVTL